MSAENPIKEVRLTPIRNGTVIDHIACGQALNVLKILGINENNVYSSISVGIHVSSNALSGWKDIIKIDSHIDIDLNVLGYIDPNITVNIIKNGVLVSKEHLELPTELVNVISCSNPRCITMTEQEIDQRFFLADRDAALYRCRYCEAAYKKKA